MQSLVLAIRCGEFGALDVWPDFLADRHRSREACVGKRCRGPVCGQDLWTDRHRSREACVGNQCRGPVRILQFAVRRVSVVLRGAASSGLLSGGLPIVAVLAVGASRCAPGATARCLEVDYGPWSEVVRGTS